MTSSIPLLVRIWSRVYFRINFTSGVFSRKNTHVYIIKLIMKVKTFLNAGNLNHKLNSLILPVDLRFDPVGV